jgi:hypothetical protein
MDSKNQFTVFCFCLAIGFLGGVIYEVFAFFRWIFGCERGKNKIFGGIFDFLFFIFFAFFCVISSFLLHFSGFRIYMWLGFGLGGALYSKTLRRIVAFLEKICYNFIYKIVIKAKARKNSLNRGMDI